MKKKATTTKETQARTSQLPNTKKMGVKKEVPAADIIQLILRDHMPLKDLIETLKDPDLSREDKTEAYDEFAIRLANHAKAEEQTLYVELKDTAPLRVAGFEGDTEHGIAEQLMQEINGTADDDEWLAKVKVLAEAVEHHIEEEEEDILVKTEENVDASTRMMLGEEYTRLKEDFDSLNVRPPHTKKRIAEQRKYN